MKTGCKNNQILLTNWMHEGTKYSVKSFFKETFAWVKSNSKCSIKFQGKSLLIVEVSLNDLWFYRDNRKKER